MPAQMKDLITVISSARTERIPALLVPQITDLRRSLLFIVHVSSIRIHTLIYDLNFAHSVILLYDVSNYKSLIVRWFVVKLTPLDYTAYQVVISAAISARVHGTILTAVRGNASLLLNLCRFTITASSPFLSLHFLSARQTDKFTH